MCLGWSVRPAVVGEERAEGPGLEGWGSCTWVCHNSILSMRPHGAPKDALLSGGSGVLCTRTSGNRLQAAAPSSQSTADVSGGGPRKPSLLPGAQGGSPIILPCCPSPADPWRCPDQTAGTVPPLLPAESAPAFRLSDPRLRLHFCEMNLLKIPNPWGLSPKQDTLCKVA